jgi:hypothetical protein
MLLVAGESAAERHGQLQDIEEIGSSRLAPHTLGLAIAADGGAHKLVIARDSGKRCGLVAQVREEGPRESVAAFAAVRNVQAIRLPGSPTGAERSTNLLTIEKMVELAAMPRLMESRAAATKPGNLEKRRNVYLRSWSQAAMVFFSARLLFTKRRGRLFQHVSPEKSQKTKGPWRPSGNTRRRA